MVAALRESIGAGSAPVRLLETHISYVLLTGDRAYKVKKAVNPGFLDFTTLERRKFYCDEELRLNRALAPSLYLGVVTITGTADHPRIGGDGPVLDYAVEMREFSQDSLASTMLARGALTRDHIDRLADRIADFHAATARADAGDATAFADETLAHALANFRQIRSLGSDAEPLARMEKLEQWTRSEYARRRDAIQSRRRDGFVRECHGDLHLANVAVIGGEVTLFDCLEFDAHLRWIDVTSEVAFTTMDLQRRGRADLARRFLNRYYERTGDYPGLVTLRFHLVYRAMVRAKVAALRASSLAAGGERASAMRECDEYLRLATDYVGVHPSAVVITHGLAGCGKTTLSQALLERMDALRLRSDVERKRLAGLAAEARSHSAITGGLYASDMTRATYDALARYARFILAAGFVALIDATSLSRWQRRVFAEVAAELAVPFVIIDISARESTLRERLHARALAGKDASEADSAVLDHQLRTREPLADEERRSAIVHDGEAPLDAAAAQSLAARVIERIRQAEGAA